MAGDALAGICRAAARAGRALEGVRSASSREAAVAGVLGELLEITRLAERVMREQEGTRHAGGRIQSPGPGGAVVGDEQVHRHGL